MILFSSARHKVTVVGDPDQSIYEWRSADSTNLSRMHEDFEQVEVVRIEQSSLTVKVNLEENYRSSHGIIAAATEVITQG
jgi:DNA helicase-2/ATP-dependent DNA helicase PcrA